jgi:hypothetical protein
MAPTAIRAEVIILLITYGVEGNFTSTCRVVARLASSAVADGMLQIDRCFAGDGENAVLCWPV